MDCMTIGTRYPGLCMLTFLPVKILHVVMFRIATRPEYFLVFFLIGMVEKDPQVCHPSWSHVIDWIRILPTFIHASWMAGTANLGSGIGGQPLRIDDRGNLITRNSLDMITPRSVTCLTSDSRFFKCFLLWVNTCRMASRTFLEPWFILPILSLLGV